MKELFNSFHMVEITRSKYHEIKQFLRIEGSDCSEGELEV